MRRRVLRLVAALALVASGVLLFAASWQRWGSCSGAEACAARQDHLVDFLPPTEPWVPVGSAAQLAGLSLLAFALALPLLPWALDPRRPGPVTAVVLVASELAVVAVGVAVLRSGLSGAVVAPVLGGWTLGAWVFGPPVLFVRFAVSARGWARATPVLLFLASPLVASLTYAIGDYDTRPWWEAVSGSFTAAAGLCLLVAAAWGPDRSLAGASVQPAVGPGVSRA